MSSEENDPAGRDVDDAAPTDPAGRQQAGNDDAARQPAEEEAIELPIEEGDFNAQPG